MFFQLGREHFSRAYLRLSLAGVQTIQELTECKRKRFPIRVQQLINFETIQVLMHCHYLLLRFR